MSHVRKKRKERQSKHIPAEYVYVDRVLVRNPILEDKSEAEDGIVEHEVSE